MEFVFVIYPKSHRRKLHSFFCWKTLLNSELDLKTQCNECTFIPSAAIYIRSIKKSPTLVNRQNMVIHCDNEIGWSVLRHTPYLPDLLLTDCYHFAAVQKKMVSYIAGQNAPVSHCFL